MILVKLRLQLFLLLVVPAMLSTGCYYYRSQSVIINSGAVEKIQQDKRYFIVHSGDSVWHLQNAIFDQNGKQISGTLQTLPSGRMAWQLQQDGKATRLKKGYLKPNKEIHLYVTGTLLQDQHPSTILFKDIEKVVIYKTSKARTITSYALGITFSLIGVMMLWIILFPPEMPGGNLNII